MTATVVDNVTFEDSGGVTTRNITKATAANLAPGDWSVIFASGNAAGPATLSAIPTGFSQVIPRLLDGTNTYLDILQRKWDASAIAGLGSETWTITHSIASKGQYPVITLRDIAAAATNPFNGWSSTSEAGSPTSHVTGALTPIGDESLLCCIVDRLTAGVLYVQNGSSDTELLNRYAAPGTSNAISQYIGFKGVPGNTSQSRTVDLLDPSLLTPQTSAAAVMFLGRIAGSSLPGVATSPPVKVRYWNGSAWVLTNKWKRHNGSNFVTGRPKPYA